MADTSLQKLVDKWSNLQGLTGNPQTSNVTDFLKNNPMISSSELKDITSVSRFGDRSPMTGQLGARIRFEQGVTDITSPQTPSFISDILSGYAKEGKSALENIKAPEVPTFNRQGYETASSMALGGNISIPQRVEDFKKSQESQYAQQYQTWQKAQDSANKAIESLNTPDTAKSATLSFTKNAIDFVLSSGQQRLGIDVSQVHNALEQNFQNFTEYNKQLQGLFTNYLNLSYNLPQDITNAMWQNNVTPGILSSEIPGLESQLEQGGGQG